MNSSAFRPLPMLYSISSEAMFDVSVTQQLIAAASATWPATDLAIYYPFRLGAPLTITLLWCWNGTAVSGNVDIGVYAADGTRIVSAGTTAQAGTSALQSFNVTDTVIGPGDYYMALAFDNTTATVFRMNPAARILQGSGMLQQATAFALPATATFAQSTNAFLPICGLSTRSFL